MSLWTVGIDPGKTGAIAVLGEDGQLLDVADMPYEDGAVIVTVLASILRTYNRAGSPTAWVEQVAARPGQGAGAMFRFAQGYGTILGTIGTLEMPTRRVTPAVWKRSMGLSKDKGASRALACELWPSWSDEFRRVKDDGRAEAALIAEYGRRQELRA